MKLHTLKTETKKEIHRVVGIDTSTIGFAYATLEDGKLVEYDEYKFTSSTLSGKMAEARAAADKIAKLNPDYAMVEQVFYMNNKGVVVKLAYFAGICFASLAYDDIPFDDVVPINWQTHIGNGRFTKEEKAAIKKEFPGKSAKWYTNKQREVRKQRTIDFVKERYGVEVTNDNIADAIGIATYAWEVMVNG